MNSKYFIFIILINLIIEINGQNSDNIEHCIDTKYHKKRPAKEDVLHKQCEPWKDYSCCSEETTIKAHGVTNHYNFNVNHCPKYPMSENCKKHFIQDLCFYECEPFVKPWVKEVNRSFAKQRIYGVPICSSDCDLWWNSCKNDYTCTSNWARGFNWTKGVNNCPEQSKCQPFHQIYSNAKEFCENVWDNSWKYTAEEEKPCMKIWFDRTKGNPNKATALYYQSSDTNSSHNLCSSVLFRPMILFLIFMFY